VGYSLGHEVLPTVISQAALRALRALRALPKVELHRHLDGSVRFQTVLDIAREHNLDLGTASEEELRRRTRITAPMPDLAAVLAGFATIQKVLCCYEAIRRVTFENVEDAWRDGVRLVELRFAPTFIADGKQIDHGEIIEAVLDGIGDGMAAYPIQVGLIGILPRDFDLEANRRATAELIRYARGRHPQAGRLCGFDLASAEDTTEPRDFLPMVEAARQAGLGITIHSGENTPGSCVERTLDLFRPSRIGHGIAAWGRGELLDRLKREGVLLEICPTSNWLTHSVASLEEHPLPELYRAGVAVCINSDDPQLMNIDLVHEYSLCARLYGFTPRDFQALNRLALAHSFLPEEIRTRVRRDLRGDARDAGGP
jgi:adenosine deaminase